MTPRPRRRGLARRRRRRTVRRHRREPRRRRPARPSRPVRRDADVAGRPPAALVLVAPRGEVADAFLADALMAAKRAASGLRASKGVLLTVARMDGAFGLMGRPPARTPHRRRPRRAWPRRPAASGPRSTPAPSTSRRTSATAPAAAFVVEELFADRPDRGRPHDQGQDDARARPRSRVPRHAHAVPARRGRRRLRRGARRDRRGRRRTGEGVPARRSCCWAARPNRATSRTGWPASPTRRPSSRRSPRRQPGTAPRALSEQTRDLLAAREIRDTLARIRAAGAEAVYRAVDVRDADRGETHRSPRSRSAARFAA